MLLLSEFVYEKQKRVLQWNIYIPLNNNMIKVRFVVQYGSTCDGKLFIYLFI